nr:unnamed protein product [Callosobruchus chinensis]
MGITTISLIVKSMCHVIWVAISADVFLSLDCDETIWRGIASSFMTRTNFPHCVGAIDGKQVRVVKPVHSGSLFYNYKNYFSVVLLAVCDSNYKFLYIDVGSFGKESDSTVLLCRARRYVECSFGILSNKWRIFHRPLKH